jgi:hypothetical protein
MRTAAVCLLIAALADPPAAVPARMRLKDGTIYRLKEPPLLKHGRFVFTTVDGKFFSIADKEVDEIQLVGPTPEPRALPNPQDSRALGAIVREHRRRTGKRALVAPAPKSVPTLGIHGP